MIRQAESCPLSSPTPLPGGCILIPGACKYIRLHDTGIKVADEIMITNRLTLRWGDYPGGFNVITRVLMNTKGRQKSQSQRELWRCYAAAFQLKGKGHKPRIQEASKTEKSREIDSSLGPPGRMQSSWHLDFSPLRIFLRCLTSRTIYNNKRKYAN